MKRVQKLMMVAAACAALVLPTSGAGQGANDHASMLAARIDSLRAQGRFAEALSVAKKLLSLEQGDASSKPFKLVEARVYVSTLEFVVGLPVATQDELAKAYGLWMVIGEHFQKAEYREGATVAETQLAVFRRVLGHDHPDLAASLYQLGTLLYSEGNYAGAEPLYREALAIQRKSLGNDHPNVAASLNKLGILLYRTGDYAGAEPFYLEALAIRRKALGNDHQDVAATLGNLGILLRAKGDYAGGEPLYREALAIRRKTFGNDHPDVAASLNNIGNLLILKGNYTEAEPLFREALAIQRKAFGNDHPDVAGSLYNLGGLLSFKGDYAGAEPLWREALAIWRKTLGNEHPDVARSLDDLGTLLYRQGDYAGAEHELSQAAIVYDASRLRVGMGIERATFQSSSYPVLAAARLMAGKTSAAWPAAERDLGRALMDLLVAAESCPLTHAEAAREDSLKKVMDNLEREVAVYQEASVTDTTGKASKGFNEARDRLTAMEAEWAKFQGEMSGKYPIAAGQPYPLDKVQECLDQETAILGWLDVGEKKTGYRSWVYLIRDEGPVVWARLERSEEDAKTSPFDRMRVFRDRLASAESPKLGTESITRTGKDRGSERLAPLSEALKGVKYLVVIPSGAMLGIPIEALVDPDGTYIGDRFVVSYIPSATIYTWLKERSRERKRTAARQSLLVGDPPFTEAQLATMENTGDLAAECARPSERDVDVAKLRYVLARNEEALSSLDRLPGTRLEVQGIAPMLPEPTLLVGPDASEQQMVQLAEAGRLKGFKTIHLATHAFVDDEQPERSALILSRANLPDPLEVAIAGTRIYDGLVTAKEILREWKLDADLVTLSACETGLGKVVGGEGYVGFAHAFLQAGARSLLVSLWKVEDRATSLLMQRFYENWTGRYSDARHGRKGQPMSKAEALKEAKHYLRTYANDDGKKPFEHPYFWSAFILIGDRE